MRRFSGQSDDFLMTIPTGSGSLTRSQGVHIILEMMLRLAIVGAGKKFHLRVVTQQPFGAPFTDLAEALRQATENPGRHSVVYCLSAAATDFVNKKKNVDMVITIMYALPEVEDQLTDKQRASLANIQKIWYEKEHSRRTSQWAKQRYAEEKRFCLDTATKWWADTPNYQLREVVQHLRDELMRRSNAENPNEVVKDETIRDWLKKAHKAGTLRIPDEARKGGRPSSSTS